MANLRDGLPRATDSPSFSPADIEYARINNQFILDNGNRSFTDKSVVVFLEYVAGSANIQVQDIDGTAVGGVIQSGTLDLSHAPMRLDGGVQLAGTTLDLAKGFYLQRAKDLSL